MANETSITEDSAALCGAVKIVAGGLQRKKKQTIVVVVVDIS